jgi:hypothetical protein
MLGELWKLIESDPNNIVWKSIIYPYSKTQWTKVETISEIPMLTLHKQNKKRVQRFFKEMKSKKEFEEIISEFEEKNSLENSKSLTDLQTEFRVEYTAEIAKESQLIFSKWRRTIFLKEMKKPQYRDDQVSCMHYIKSIEEKILAEEELRQKKNEEIAKYKKKTGRM